MRLLIVFSFFYVNLWNVEALLVNLQKPCVPTASVKGPCHTCICNAEAIFDCHAIPCDNQKTINPRISIKDECEPHMTYRFEELFCTCNYKGKWMSYNCRETFQFLRSDGIVAKYSLRSKINSNEIKYNELPEIEEGQSCIPDRLYKMACNTCRCGPNSTLVCTKIACLENKILEEIEYLKVKAKRRQNVESKEKKRKNQHTAILNFPKLPKGDCISGKIYSKGCRKCFCNESKIAVCTKTCSENSKYMLDDKEILQMESRSLTDLPELPHTGSQCEPGKSYYVDCNRCLCTDKRDLVCTFILCMTIDSFEKVYTDMLTGLPCKKDYKELCTECKCVKGKSECKTIKSCNIKSTKQLLSTSGRKIKLTLDTKKEKCVPNSTYKVHCNECHCQSDGTLRCTQRVCLSYSQAKNLKEREEYLLKHGL